MNGCVEWMLAVNLDCWINPALTEGNKLKGKHVNWLLLASGTENRQSGKASFRRWNQDCRLKPWHHGVSDWGVDAEGQGQDDPQNCGSSNEDAAEQLNVNPPFGGLKTVQSWQTTKSTNLHRRHLSETQREVVAAKVANLDRGHNQHTSNDGCSAADAAEKLNVSKPSVERAKAAIKGGCKELVEAMERSEITSSLAAKFANLKEGRPSETLSNDNVSLQEAAEQLNVSKPSKTPSSDGVSVKSAAEQLNASKPSRQRLRT